MLAVGGRETWPFEACALSLGLGSPERGTITVPRLILVIMSLPTWSTIWRQSAHTLSCGPRRDVSLVLCANGATGKEVGPAEEGLHKVGKVGKVYKVQKVGDH